VELGEAGVETYGISRDSPWTHIAWKQALDVDIALLSDWNGDAVDAFGVGRDFRGMHGVPLRAAFLIDGGGTVRAAWRYDDGEVPDFDELVRAAQQLRS
jgi:peroxiredoxin